jgi:uncharacterized protein with HEPN domain
MHADAPALIWDAHRAATRIAQFTTGRSHEDYLTDELLRSAVERQLEVVGEALNQLRKLDLATAALVPSLAQAVGLRNVISHGYAALDHDRVWRAATCDVPQLIDVLDALLPSAAAP